MKHRASLFNDRFKVHLSEKAFQQYLNFLRFGNSHKMTTASNHIGGVHIFHRNNAVPVSMDVHGSVLFFQLRISLTAQVRNLESVSFSIFLSSVLSAFDSVPKNQSDMKL